MQLVSDEFLESQAAVAFRDSEGKLRGGFSTDRMTPPRDDPDVGPRETVKPDGGVTRMVTSPPAELRPLGNPLVDEVLPPNTPNEECVRVILKDREGDVR